LGCEDIGGTSELSNEKWVSDYIAKALAGKLHDDAWRSTQRTAETVAEKWKQYGSGSEEDPTNGCGWAFAAETYEWDETFQRYDKNKEFFDTFRWASSPIFTLHNKQFIFFVRDTIVP
jgi:hypothetical protein